MGAPSCTFEWKHSHRDHQMLLRPSGLIGHSLRSGKSPNLCFRSINEVAAVPWLQKSYFHKLPSGSLWIFSQSDPEHHPFFVSQKSCNPDEWQGRTVNLLWLVVSKMFFFFPRWLLHHQPVMKTGVYQRVSHLAPHCHAP